MNKARRNTAKMIKNASGKQKIQMMYIIIPNAIAQMSKYFFIY
jgi:hypothetical protein